MRRSEDVPDMTARDRLHSAPAHPNPERKLQVFSAPADHARVVRADVEEELSVDAKETSGHGGRWRGVTGLAIGRRVLVGLPGEVARPV